MIIKTTLVRKWNAGATAIWPFILMDPKYWIRTVFIVKREKLLDHEKIHHKQQLRYLLWGLPMGPAVGCLAAWGFTWPTWAIITSALVAALSGLALWYILYFTSKEFVRKVETEAYREGSGWDDEAIMERLAKPPYNIDPKLSEFMDIVEKR